LINKSITCRPPSVGLGGCVSDKERSLSSLQYIILIRASSGGQAYCTPVDRISQPIERMLYN
jgi:hypothetical protein